MVAKNDITGDSIQTKGVTDNYRNHYDEIFRKNKNTNSDQNIELAVSEDRASLDDKSAK